MVMHMNVHVPVQLQEASRTCVVLTNDMARDSPPIPVKFLCPFIVKLNRKATIGKATAEKGFAEKGKIECNTLIWKDKSMQTNTFHLQDELMDSSPVLGSPASPLNTGSISTLSISPSSSACIG